MPAGKVNPIPDMFRGVTPALCARDAAKAIDFYKKAFGATEIMKFVDPGSGKIAHAELKIGEHALFMLADVHPGFNHSPEEFGGATTVNLYVYVPDVDRFVERAVAAGAKLVMPVKTQFYGDRSARLQDPIGYIWIFATHVEDVPEEELVKRMKSQKPG
jgi:PhnB protein